MNAISISLSPELDDFVRAQVDAGHYMTSGEVVREALMLLQDREDRRVAKLAWLRAEVQRGLDSGLAEPMDWDDLRHRIREHAKKLPAQV